MVSPSVEIQILRVAVTQSFIQPMEDIMRKCVEEPVDIKKDHQMVLLALPVLLNILKDYP